MINTEGTGFVYETEMPKKLGSAQKIAYKKSLAKMMVYWIINTRQIWLYRLLTRDFQSWRDKLPYIAGAFASSSEFYAFLDRACKVVESRVMMAAMQTMNDESMKDWVEMDIDPVCPADEAIDLMYRAFADRVDSLPEN